MSTIFKNLTTSGSLNVGGSLTSKDNLIVNGTKEIRINEDNNTNYIGIKAPSTVTSSAVFELPDGFPTSGIKPLVVSNLGVMSYATSAAGDILNGGNSTGGTVVIGTNDAQSLELETNGTTALTIDTSGNVIIANNLTISGTTTTINTETLAVEDPLIILGSGNNAANTVDIGFYGLYDPSGSLDLYAGLFKDSSDSDKFKLFKDLQTVPTTTVNTAGTGYTPATLVLGTLESSNTILDPNSATGGALVITNTTTQTSSNLVSITGQTGQTALNVTAGNVLISENLTVTGVLKPGTLSLDDSDSAFFLNLISSSTITTADKSLTFDVNDANRNISLNGNVTTAGDLITSGSFSLTLTQTGTTNVTLPTTGTLASLAGTETLTNKTLTTPIVNGATLSIDDTDSAFNLNIISTSTITTADKSLTFDVNDTNRTVSLNGNVTTAGDLITSGSFSLTLTQTGTTDVTLPTTGTLATLAGTETLTNKTLSGVSATLDPNAASGGAIVITNTTTQTSGDLVSITGVSGQTALNVATGDVVFGGDVNLGGGVIYNVTAVSSNTTLNASHYLVSGTSGAGGITLTLPAVATNSGRKYIITKADAGVGPITIDGNLSETIGDGASLTIDLTGQYDRISLISDGVIWHIV